jgi:1-deoxy-D-xylulose-5-phosphate synthase
MPGLLSTIRSPQDLRALPADQLPALAAEIRTFLIEQVSQTGGHLGPNLGVVELTIAVHRTFESPSDPILFDTGHQAYVHKILTGRQDRFPTLRQRGGLSGYPNRAESAHDWIENSHASTALSYADGLAKALRQQGRPGTVLAFVGDGSLTGGMAWEALNNIAADDELPLVILVNDNGRSYTPTVGGLARQLSGLRTNPHYEQILDVVKRNVSRAPLVGSAAYDVLHGIKIGLKDLLAPQGMFSDLGLKYVGPIDGHDVAAVERALLQAKQFGGPVLVHCLTRKGNGFSAAEAHEEDRFHAVGKINSTTGESLAGPSALKWTDVFSEELLRLGSIDERLVAITAAMTYPTGLNRFARAFPDRVFDVGIAEQHAVTSAAGLAMGGLHPVVAVYATFLNRGFDQLLMDVALHRCGVTFALDRAGITGPDGASHHGMWDMSILQLVPGLHLSAPRDAVRLRQALANSLAIEDAPSVIRYSNQQVPDEIPAKLSVAGMDVVLQTESPKVLVVGFGEMVATAVSVGQRLADQGIGVTVLDPVWALPVNPELIRMAAEHDLVISIEDNGIVGGCGARLAQEMRLADVPTPIREFGIEQRFLEHGSRSELLEELRLTPQHIARYAVEAMVRNDVEPSPSPPTHAPRSGLSSGTPTDAV